MRVFFRCVFWGLFPAFMALYSVPYVAQSLGVNDLTPESETTVLFVYEIFTQDTRALESEILAAFQKRKITLKARNFGGMTPTTILRRSNVGSEIGVYISHYGVHGSSVGAMKIGCHPAKRFYKDSCPYADIRHAALSLNALDAVVLVEERSGSSHFD
ncbi:hypothetical protein GCM10011309_01730 [Litorimonas cladophorae]|uniref:Uncharacterized protein n=1 Tax=Litorimonas cladophorae TaxID=1220491 RepID=A0A918KAA1_9PROT|nr:hypothetical protein GCM10011309_01730 [Litorimonas cladophorae]